MQVLVQSVEVLDCVAVFHDSDQETGRRVGIAGLFRNQTPLEPGINSEKLTADTYRSGLLLEQVKHVDGILELASLDCGEEKKAETNLTGNARTGRLLL